MLCCDVIIVGICICWKLFSRSLIKRKLGKAVMLFVVWEWVRKVCMVRIACGT